MNINPTIGLIFRIVALILFIFYAAEAVFSQPVNLGLGLAALVVSFIIP